MAITDEARLRALYGAPSPRARAKVLDRLDRHARAFIAASPFAIVATSDGERLDASPKGDRPGFAVVEDERHLLLPDWPGNARLDGYRNILAHPRVALLFLIPGVRETLRVNGTATIHDEEALRAACAHRGRLPVTVMRIAVEEVFLHCAKALLRSRLWEPESWPAERPVPGMSTMLRDQIGPRAGAESDAETEERYRRQLAEREGRD